MEDAPAAEHQGCTSTELNAVLKRPKAAYERTGHFGTRVSILILLQSTNLTDSLGLMNAVSTFVASRAEVCSRVGGSLIVDFLFPAFEIRSALLLLLSAELMWTRSVQITRHPHIRTGNGIKIAVCHN